LNLFTRTNKIEIGERVLCISQLLLEGKRTKEICRIASEKWKISRRQVERYIASAYKNWYKEFEKRRRTILEYHVALRMNLYSISYEQKNYPICLQILKDLAKLEGLYDKNNDLQDTTIVVKLPEDLKHE
jgi:predicted transcriptional regulator